ncbi:MAG: DUF4911 domain-containing protein [Desulfobacterales bacterium]
MKTTIQYYRVDRRQIAFIKFIFEAYDGIAGIRTTDPVKGIIKLHIAPGCQEQVEQVLRDLKKEILIRRLETEFPESG